MPLSQWDLGLYPADGSALLIREARVHGGGGGGRGPYGDWLEALSLFVRLWVDNALGEKSVHEWREIKPTGSYAAFANQALQPLTSVLFFFSWLHKRKRHPNVGALLIGDWAQCCQLSCDSHNLTLSLKAYLKTLKSTETASLTSLHGKMTLHSSWPYVQCLC